MVTYLEWFGLLVLPAFLLLDLVYRARRFRTPRGWRLVGFAVSAGALALSLAIAAFWGSVFDGTSLLPGEKLGFAGGTLVGILVYEFCHYWYHRTAHAWQPLWLAAHQMHHAPESLDAFVAFSVAFQHANVRTPRWLGYLVQRPESHAVHHERGIHRYNYSDLPLWDIVFGTFRNPARWAGEVGFHDGASRRIPEMLIARDVSAPRPIADMRAKSRPPVRFADAPTRY